MTLAKVTIGARIFAAFAAMTVLIGATGFVGYGALAAEGDSAAAAFDGSLMAVSYARAAQADFTQMQVARLRHEQAPPEDRKAFAAEIAALAAAFGQDLDEAAGHAQAAGERRLIAEIGPLVRRWRADAGPGAQRRRLDRLIGEKFDLLVELSIDHGFAARRKAIAGLRYRKDMVIALTVSALLLAGGIALFLRRAIIPPAAIAKDDEDKPGIVFEPMPAARAILSS